MVRKNSARTEHKRSDRRGQLVSAQFLPWGGEAPLARMDCGCIVVCRFSGTEPASIRECSLLEGGAPTGPTLGDLSGADMTPSAHTRLRRSSPSLLPARFRPRSPRSSSADLIMRSQSMKKRLKPRRPAKSSQRRSTVSVLREPKSAKADSRWRSLERRHFRALVK